jgi:integrase
MTKVRFNLKNKQSKNETLIILIFNFDNQRLKISTQCSVNPKFWNQKNQRVKELMELPNHRKINLRLEELNTLMIQQYNILIDEYGYVEKDVLKSNFSTNMLNPIKQKSIKSFWDYYEDFIVFKRKQLNDIKDYHNSLRKHLQNTEKILGKKASFNSIKKLDNGFVEAMNDYLIHQAVNSKGEKGLAVNTVWKQFKNLKVFLNWCFEREYTPKFSIKHISAKQEEVNEIYLTQAELDNLNQLTLTDPEQTKIRDAFLIGCETALRYSDLKLLRKEHINVIDKKIRMENKKTQKKVVIPISTIAINILHKYDYNSPIFGGKSITDFNKGIKDICKKAGLTTNVVLYKTLKNKRLEIVHQKYELVSSHTCRRTFCTLKIIEGIPVSLIMKITGHKTEKSFFRYLKMDEETAADKMSEYID